MNHLLQSVVLTEIARVASLTPDQALRIANWLLDHDVRFVSHAPLTHGIPSDLFSSLRDLCLQDKRISAIKELRQWAADQLGRTAEGAAIHPFGTLRAAKDFIDEHFPRTKVREDFT